ncbi:MAG: hypothetical protein K2O59_16345 [Lachnospiraceae bacterium]|nr:hypothetical protein [Lachnospiraceae bacterium]
MIYSAWYFCNITKLSIVETKGVLTAVQALSCLETDFEEKNRVIDRLGEYDSLIQSYMIPYLTECLMTSDNRKWLDQLPELFDKQEYIEKIENRLISFLPKSKSLPMTNLVQNIRNVKYESIVKLTAAYSGNAHTLQEERCNYLQGDRFVQEIFLLSVLRCIAYENVDVISDLVRGDKQIELMQSALSGNFGQLCWNIATEIMLQCGISTEEVIRSLPENWQEQPDMVELMIPFLFPDDKNNSVEKIMEETYKLTQFKKYWTRQKKSENGGWINANAAKDEHTRSCIILWQNVLWNLAMNRNFDGCVEALKNIWKTPEFSKGKIKSSLWLNSCQLCMLPKNTGIYNDDQVQRYVCSPWQERTESDWNKGREKKGTAETAEEELFHEFRGFVRNDSGMRVFMAAYLLERIFIIQNREIDDFFIRLLLHFGDLFSCYGARSTFQQVTSPPLDGIRVTTWELPIRAFGYFSCDIIKNIGMGLINKFVPEKIINHLNKRSPLVGRNEAYKNKQLEYLYNSCAFLASAYWAYESLSTTSISRNGVANMWIKNGHKSSAAKLCDWIFSNLYKLAVNERNAVQLSVQTFDAKYSRQKKHTNPAWLNYVKSNKSFKVRFSQLILSRKLKYAEWYDVGDITRQKFEKDAYLIAHTLRIRSLLESEYSAAGHEWIGEWKNAVSDISYKWEFSRMARYIMVQMFSTNPGHQDNYSVLLDLLKMIIFMIHEFASLDSIYYIYCLSESLVTFSDEWGAEDGKELKGMNAVELYRNMNNTALLSDSINKWSDLFFYYLLKVSDNTEVDSERYAGNLLKKYWEKKKIQRNHLRTELIDASQWNQLTERMWTVKGDKILVVRDALDLPKDCNTGIVAEAHKDGEKTLSFEIYSEGGESRFKGVPNKKLYMGDLVKIIGSDLNRIESFDMIKWKPAKGEKLHAAYEVTGDEIYVSVMGTQITEKFGDSPELFWLWNGDFSELFSKGHSIKGKTAVQYAEYSAGKCSWIPYMNGYAEFLVQRMFLPDNPDRKCTLTFLGKTDICKGFLFSAKAGENYILEADNWTQESWKKLEDELTGRSDRKGIKIRVHLVNVDDFPCLELDTEEPYDDRNIRWREQFANEQPFQIWYEDNKWVTETDVQEIRKRVVVYVKNRGRLTDTDSKYIVQVANGGWEEINQRKGYLEAEQVKNRVLDSRAITYDELKRLIEIKPGDVFKLKNIQLKWQNKAYYAAELDNQLPVFCAVESFSMLPDSKDTRFWRNRLCIVDNVREIKNFAKEDANKAEPCNPVALRDKQGKYIGIIAEFTPIINSKWESVNNLSIKVFMDIDEGKEVLDVPVSAFVPKPQHVGDRIEAERVEGGWIFRTFWRTINVRTLWQLEDHRGQKNAPIFGTPLGLTNIARIGNCMVTQDEEKPVLHLWNPEVDFQYALTMQCGIQSQKGKVEQIVWRYSDRKIFRWAYQTEIIELHSEGNVFIGEARAGAFKKGSKEWRVKPEIYRIFESVSGTFYDLRRCFIPISAGTHQNDLSKEIEEERRAYYQEWLAENSNCATGQINGQLHNADKIELKELYVPSAIANFTADVEWVNEIPLEERQRPIVPRIYSTDDVRVKLKISNGKYIASVNDVEAMLLDQALIDCFGAADGYIEERDFYFAGRDDQERLLFEWGYGYVFAADIQDVTDINGNSIGNELFFGDQITSFMFCYDESGKYHWKVKAKLEWICHKVEGQVWQDAEKNIIQLLKVRINQTDGNLEIYEVSVADRSIKTSRKQNDGWKFLRIGNARLKSEDTETLVSQIRKAQKETIILACLDRQNYDKASRWREFSYIPLDGSRDKLEILNNKTLCLTAGRIKDTTMQQKTDRVVNDQKLDFFLPDELPDICENPHLIVSVMRRYFSLDESRLRIYSQVNPDAFYRINMLVMLQKENDERNGIWSGSVLGAPFRANDSLISLVELRKQCIVTLGIVKRNEQIFKCAEIVPGIIFDITKYCKEMYLVDGSLALLRVVGGELIPEVVLPGDRQYIPDDGRPIELLIMDGALNNYEQTVDMDEEQARETKMSLGGHFTLAGFPQIRVKNVDLLDRLIRSELPRLGMIYKNAEKKLEVRAVEENVSAGYLEVSQESGTPILNLISPVSRSVYTSWDQITFMDGKPEEIIEYVQCGVWHYHDRFTAVYTDEDKCMHLRNLPDGQNYKDILVFAGEGYRLRYLKKEIRKYLMSAREIVENGLPNASRWYPIAGVTDHSLWIEIFPGKILELLRTYLFAGNDKSELSKLYVGAFAPGDKIMLDEEKTVVGGHGKILLLGFKFGLRSAIGRGRAFLPVQNREEDSLCLGGGFWTMNYPNNTMLGLHGESKFVMLDQNNKLSDAKLTEQVMTGDCVFLTIDARGRLCIAGGYNIKVEFCEESLWGEMAWLLRALQHDWHDVLNLFMNYLPVTVTGKNKTGTKVWVVYKCQNNHGLDENMTLCCNCIGMIRYLEKKRVILRSGGYLFYIDEEEFMQGVDNSTREIIVHELSKRRTEFLASRIDGKWKVGLDIQDDPEKVEIQILYAIPKAKGFLCRNRKNLSLRWLPQEYSCRVQYVETEKIWKVLSENRNRIAKLMENGTLSLNHEQDCYRRFSLLDTRSTKYRVIPKVELGQEAGYFYYLSELYPSGDLLMLKSENSQECGQDEPVRVAFLEKQETSVVVVPLGQMRQKIFLSPWITQAYRSAYRYEEKEGYLDCEVFQEYIPERFDNYLEVIEQAKEDINSGILGNDTLRIPNGLEDRLVYLYELLQQAKKGTSVSIGRIYPKIYDTLKAWLSYQGKVLASGFYNSEKYKNSQTLDLLPTITAILLLNRISYKNNLFVKELVVHLMCMLGYASSNSLHQEVLLRLWLLNSNQGGVWKRLNRLSLGGESMEDRFKGIESEPSEVFDGTLNEGQYSTLIEIAESIAGRYVEDKDAKVVAESLLYSVGVERDYTDFYLSLNKQDYCCFKLAPLGRILILKEDKCQNIYELANKHKNTLVRALASLRHKKQPIELLTYIPIPLSEEQRRNAIEKCDKVIEFLTQQLRG